MILLKKVPSITGYVIIIIAIIVLFGGALVAEHYGNLYAANLSASTGSGL